jgi:uncharacterized membrane protein YgcG
MRRSTRWLVRGAFLAVFIVAATMAIVLPAATPGRGASTSGSDERIINYNAQIAIQHDGSIRVTEEIVYDFGADQRHGIFRVIPTRVRYNGRYDRVYPIDVRSVQAGTPNPEYSVHSSGSSLSIKIGDPDLTVTGAHSYTITYVVRRSLNAFADHDELYWNALGNQWGVPVNRATVRVSAPGPVSRAACFAGPAGSTSRCQHAAITNGVASFAQHGLGPHQGLTVVVAIPKGVVASPGPLLRERWSLQRAFAVTPVSAGAAGGLFAIVAILGAVMLARGRDRQYAGSVSRVVAGRPVQDEKAIPLSGDGNGPPPVQSAPPPDVRPGHTGTLLTDRATPRDVTATVVDLAVRGYLTIEETARTTEMRRDWRLVRLKKKGDLLDYEQLLLDALFAGGGSRHGARSTLMSELGSDFTGSLREAEGALATDVTERGWFTSRPDVVRLKWIIIGGLVLVAGLAATIAAAAFTHYGLVPVPLALAGLALIIFARWMPVRTAKGTEVARKLEGFRRHITTTAGGQAHHAGQAHPADQGHPGGPDVLDAYLPYAIAFGCTKEWADATAAMTDGDRVPSWYRGAGQASAGDLAVLSGSAYYFSSMHHFAASTSTWLAHQTSGRRGGFLGGGSGSGFSGGFSGGGGGGGGGGSW